MMKYGNVCAMVLLLIFCISCNPQTKTDLLKDNTKTDFEDVIISNGPNSITRTIKQDRAGNIWMAAFDGIFKYDGNSFTNMTSEVTSDRFFSILEDRKGNFWFGSIGSGVYYYDGKSFQNFTTNEGLASNEIVCIYEDKTGNIWFGANGGASRYDGKFFQNYMMSGDSILEVRTGEFLMDFSKKEKLPRTVNEVNTIIEDKTGKFWFGTRGKAFVYDGKTFTSITHNDQPFFNVRWIIEDRNGNIWLGGKDGLWRYDGSTFTNITQHFVGYIYEDKNGNIWTSSQNTNGFKWMLSRYDEKSLSSKNPMVTEIKSEYEGNKGMIFGILEANDGSIWFGGLDGVYRYDGHTITGFKAKVVQD